MAKKPTITTIASGYYSRQALNTNFENLRDSFDNTLSLDGSTPNAMGADLDMNNNDLLNGGNASLSSLSLGGSAVTAFSTSPYSSRALAIAETIPASITNILVNTPDGDTLAYKYDATGTALTTAGGRNWSPDGVATPQHFGSVNDKETLADGAMTAGSGALSGTGSFTASDVGKIIRVQGAGAAGVFLEATISAVTDANNITVTPAASTTVSSATVEWFTDNTYAEQLLKSYLVVLGSGSFTSRPVPVDYSPFSAFGGSWSANAFSRSLDTVGGKSGSRSNFTAIRESVGSGLNGPDNSDYAISAESKKRDYLTSTIAGEVDGMRVTAIQGGVSDAGAALFGGYKTIGDGTIDEGGLTTIEASCVRFVTGLTDPVSSMQSIVGFSPNPQSAWSGRDTIGFYSENHIGAGFSNFLGITDGANAGVGTMQYLISGFGERDITTKYFSVDYLGNIESTSYDVGAGSAPTWVRNRSSESPAANDLIGEDIFRGKNSSGGVVDYVRSLGTIKDPTAGSEDGGHRTYTLVGGASALQITVENGIAVGPVPTVGTGTLNVQKAIHVNSTARIDASGGIRPAVYTSAQLADITNAVNTADKFAGKTVWDSTGNRLLSAGGSAASDSWYVANGLVALNPS